MTKYQLVTVFCRTLSVADPSFKLRRNRGGKLLTRMSRKLRKQLASITNPLRSDQIFSLLSPPFLPPLPLPASSPPPPPPSPALHFLQLCLLHTLSLAVGPPPPPPCMVKMAALGSLPSVSIPSKRKHIYCNISILASGKENFKIG